MSGINQVQDLDALRSQQDRTGVWFVRFHTYDNTQGAIQDEGGGIFEWVASVSGSPADNNGSIIKPNSGYSGSGRWVRQADVRGPVHAEWFGAKGDGSTDDRAAIQLCLDAFGRVRLLATTYVICGAITLKADDIIEGTGMDKTVIRVDVPEPTPQVYQKVAAFGSPNEGSDRAVIRDLTIDCRFSESGASAQRYTTREAIELKGSGILVERVKAVNFGTSYNPDEQGDKYSGGECFVISLILPDGTATQGNTIQDCVITAPGTRAAAINITAQHPIAEITGLTIGRDKEDGLGQTLPQQKLALGGRIARNKIFDFPYQTGAAPYQYSMPHLITIFNSDGAEVAENEIVNCDGTGVYIASWTDRNTVIRNNRMLGVNSGVSIGVIITEMGYTEQGQGYDPDKDLHPCHRGLSLEENLIILGRNATAVQKLEMQGVVLFMAAELPDNGIRLQDLAIQRNVIRGQKVTAGSVSSYPTGILLHLNSFFFEGLLVADNVLEVADCPPDGLGTKYEQALIFFASWMYLDGQYELFKRRLGIHGNRNMAGADVRLRFGWPNANYLAWGPYSTRRMQFQAPSFDGAARAYYDEFLGQVPRSSLGWVNGSDNGGSISSADAEVDRPGIVRLSTGTNSNGYAMLKYRDGGIVLGGGLGHIVEFAAKRGEGTAVAEVRLGFMQAGGDAGVYFKFARTASGAPLRFICRKTDGSETVYTFQVTDDAGSWLRYRIEVAPDASEIKVFRSVWDPQFHNNSELVYLQSCQDGIPKSTALGFAFKITQAANETDRTLLVDYYQHHIF